MASKAGIQLENILDFLTYQYRCFLPRQTDPNYALGDLASGIDSKLGNILKIIKKGGNGDPDVEKMLKPLIDQATALPWVEIVLDATFIYYQAKSLILKSKILDPELLNCRKQSFVKNVSVFLCNVPREVFGNASVAD